MILTGDRIQLSLPIMGEEEEVLSFYQSNKAFLAPWEPIREESFYTLEHWSIQLEKDLTEFERGLSTRFFIKDLDDNKLLGMVNFTNFERGPFQNCRLGYKLGESSQGKGIMKEALSLGIDFIFNELNFHRIEANYIPNNERSARLLEKLNFVRHGSAKSYLKIAGKWQDHILTSLVNNLYEKES